MNIYEQILTYVCIIQETKNRDIQLQNAKSNFPKFCKVYAWQNTKYKSSFAVILNSKIVFKKLF